MATKQSTTRRPPRGLPRISDWDRAGRALRELSPESYARVLAVAEGYAGLSRLERREAAAEDQRRAAARAKFRVIDGGLAGGDAS